MENKKIWHTPDENPNTFNVYPILVLYEAGDTPEIMSSKDYFQLTHYRYVNRWCYWDEFIKSVDAPKKNLLTNSQSELVDSICNEAVTITCSDGKTIGVKNGN